MFIQSKKNPEKNNVSQALKLMGATGLVVAGTEQISAIVNKKASQITPKDYLVGGVLSGIIAGSVYGAVNLFVPMWREVTEYRPDTSPFLKMSSYLDLPHHHINDDVYS